MLASLFGRGGSGQTLDPSMVDPYENPQGPTWQPADASQTASFSGSRETAPAADDRWKRALVGGLSAAQKTPASLNSPFGQSASEAWPTLASPIQFQTVAQFLASLQGKGAQR